MQIRITRELIYHYSSRVLCVFIAVHYSLSLHTTYIYIYVVLHVFTTYWHTKRDGKGHLIHRQDEIKVVLSTLSIATGTTIDTVLIGRNHTLFLHHHLLLKGGNETWLFEAIVRTE
jgi:hypothetical protein